MLKFTAGCWLRKKLKTAWLNLESNWNMQFAAKEECCHKQSCCITSQAATAAVEAMQQMRPARLLNSLLQPWSDFMGFSCLCPLKEALRGRRFTCDDEVREARRPRFESSRKAYPLKERRSWRNETTSAPTCMGTMREKFCECCIHPGIK